MGGKSKERLALSESRNATNIKAESSRSTAGVKRERGDADADVSRDSKAKSSRSTAGVKGEHGDADASCDSKRSLSRNGKRFDSSMASLEICLVGMINWHASFTIAYQVVGTAMIPFL